MRIEAICACLNYSDFLSLSLPENLPLLDRIIVVTASGDRETQSVCARFGSKVEVVQTDQFYLNGAPCNRGAALNAAFPRMSKDGWILHLDADIIIPAGVMKKIREMDLDKETLYGVNRCLLKTYESFDAWVLEGRPTVVPQRTNEGPIGFFQLFHPSSSGLKIEPWYPEGFPGTAWADLKFIERWKICLVLPLCVIHLGSPGVDWEGRKSSRFGPPNRRA